MSRYYRTTFARTSTEAFQQDGAVAISGPYSRLSADRWMYRIAAIGFVVVILRMTGVI